MGQYGITGWSGGARVPLTYNLKAGQMRGMGRSYIFPNNTYVNNNFYGSNYDCGCNCNYRFAHSLLPAVQHSGIRHDGKRPVRRYRPDRTASGQP